MHFTLGERMESLKSIIGHDTIVYFSRFIALIFRSLCCFQICLKGEDIFSPFQQRVHPLQDLEKFFFFEVTEYEVNKEISRCFSSH